MKKTFFFLASITAIALLSCSIENTDFSAENLNHEQSQASTYIPIDDGEQLGFTPLAKPSQSYEEKEVSSGDGATRATGNFVRTYAGNMTASGSSTSNAVAFDMRPSQPATITSVEFCGTELTVRNFTSPTLYIQCDAYSGADYSYSTNGCTRFDFLNGQPTKNTICYVWFSGACGSNCYRSLGNTRLVFHFQY